MPPRRSYCPSPLKPFTDNPLSASFLFLSVYHVLSVKPPSRLNFVRRSIASSHHSCHKTANTADLASIPSISTKTRITGDDKSYYRQRGSKTGDHSPCRFLQSLPGFFCFLPEFSRKKLDCRKVMSIRHHHPSPLDYTTRLHMGFGYAILFYVMADVMGLGHGGDGAGDPLPPVGFGRGQHEQDAELPKKRRGLAKNIQHQS
ncbi:unnamed protein product [Lactuca virosa]|uniref:Uncharacterized protein n=1 Tax=Lactuca virosa TaxID=75947 RepID=A0AAU9MTL3_9ASTR|nr:unnamed protein product [Lactuca virosa]